MILFFKFDKLLRFHGNTTILANTTTESPNRIEIGRGLGYLDISCDTVHRNKIVNTNSKRSSIYFDSIYFDDIYFDNHYRCMDCYGNLTINVRANNDSMFIGLFFLFDLYNM